ncbi:hypothetical protein [Autumnicola edwardsiae]|jgi:hypothetical protein|uniref:Uncharacterized protein n=1 Tax=Autumnicola edwardsiae TaxID=3075594 RepID=A0ABU3CRP1_9FLAO|nr:hypothetical protein [Zunongwangia sp. F297]MDT0649023.1 hypothetical protein [Zunongwangia sp. F297]
MSALIQEINYIQTTEEEYNQIASVKILVDEVYAKGNFFHLPLKTLELIRRFNGLFDRVVKEEEQTPSLVNQLIINSQHLEQQLMVQEF